MSEKNQVRLSFNKSATSYNQHGILQKEIANRLFENLQTIKLQPKKILDLGAGTGFLTHQLNNAYKNSQVIALDFAQESLKINLKNSTNTAVCADVYHLPFTDNSIDIITSNLMLQWCSDYQKVFLECFRVLKPNGVFMFSTFGVDTLKELKKSWENVDNNPHINQFTDMHLLGDTLLQQGFFSPIIEMENIILTYDKVIDLIQDLKGIGANTVQQRKSGLITPNKFNKMQQNYEQFRVDNKLPATYEVIYAHGFKPEIDYEMNSFPKVKNLSI
ncbi:Biotin synthesis protein BioC [hydrothermal vent metagenome]|uniref:malonyl-[acyl-carrier protein] O-methyltransferase n=1 Tax=hydrothermal vent metagenome TaxID=652676 RepID=A0A1W1CJ65_9ZZZZ